MCGLKFDADDFHRLEQLGVTPFAGVWVEMGVTPMDVSPAHVTPFAGVWVEIIVARLMQDERAESHPSRVCGLKLESGES